MEIGKIIAPRVRFEPIGNIAPRIRTHTYCHSGITMLTITLHRLLGKITLSSPTCLCGSMAGRSVQCTTEASDVNFHKYRFKAIIRCACQKFKRTLVAKLATCPLSMWQVPLEPIKPLTLWLFTWSALSNTSIEARTGWLQWVYNLFEWDIESWCWKHAIFLG